MKNQFIFMANSIPQQPDSSIHSVNRAGEQLVNMQLSGMLRSKEGMSVRNWRYTGCQTSRRAIFWPVRLAIAVPSRPSLRSRGIINCGSASRPHSPP